jgi:uncharacterized secreted protein with C-terminal beta-propeller domain
MNKKDRNAFNAFRSAYEGAEMPELPDELSKESIVNMLDQKEVPKTKRRKKYIPLKAVLAATLAIAVIAGSSVVYEGISAGVKLQKSYTSQAIETASDYKEIKKIFEKINKQNNNATWIRSGFFGKATADLAQEEGLGSAPGNNSNVGKTNVQVEGVDEADIIKNDGKYLYRLVFDKLYIISLLPADKMKVAETINIYDDIKIAEKKTSDATQSGSEGSGSGDQSGASSGRTDAYYPEYDYLYEDGAIDADEFYIYGNTLTVLGNVCDFTTGKGYKTFVNIYDISDISKVTLKKQFLQDGLYLSSRLIGGDLYILSNFSVSLNSDEVFSEESCIPTSGYSDNIKTVPAKDICIVSEPDYPSYLIASGLNLDNLKAGATTKSVLGAGENAYCNAESLFVARTKCTYTSNVLSDVVAEIYTPGAYDCLTEIYRFSLDDGKITFDCKGAVDGTIDDGQFSMDEYNGYFRIATTGSDKKGVTSGGVYVLDKNMKTVGKITGLAKGERIYAVRFIGETAYVVTFEQTAPLCVIDLSKPESPALKGELKIAGFSEYLHPVGKNLLLGIGKNGDLNGITPGIKISLFDVSDPQKPIEVDRRIFGGNSASRNFTTDAWYTHKAVMVYSEKNLYGIPVWASDYSSGIKELFLTIRIENNKIINDYLYPLSEDKTGYYSIDCRGTYIDDTIYISADRFVKAFSMTDGSLLGEIEL